MDEECRRGVVAVVYAPCVVTTQIGKTRVRTETVTDYPFRKSVEIHVNPEEMVKFRLSLRLPQGERVTVSLNGAAVDAQMRRDFISLERLWSSDDVVRLEFAMKPRMIGGFDNSVSVMRGPLVFSLPIKEKWNKLRDHGLTADWEVLGESQWNYGLVETTAMTVSETALNKVPFSKAARPVTLHTDAIQIANWQAEEGVAGDFPAIPELGQAAAEKIMLVPYASSKLRMTSFPLLNDSLRSKAHS